MLYRSRPARASTLEYIVATVTLPVLMLAILGFMGPSLGNVMWNHITNTPNVTYVPQQLVVTKLADTNDGICNADCSLREAIAAAIHGSTITFAPGLSGTITLTNGELAITKHLIVYGPGASIITVSGNNASRVFNVYGVEFELWNLTVADGYFQPTVGGSNGGAFVVASPAVVTINNSVFQNSRSYNGGAIYSYGILTINNSTIRNNTASGNAGGGIYSEGKLTILNSTLYGNTAQSKGGAIAHSVAPLALYNTTIQGNTVTRTGSIYYGGGGIALDMYYDTSTTAIVNSTIANNSGFSGNNIWVYGQAPVLQNTIVSNGSGGTNCRIVYPYIAPVTNGGNNLQYPDTSCNSAIPVSDPLLGSLADNGGSTWTMALLTGSPAIDAGNDTICAASPINNQDQRGLERPFDGDSSGSALCDIGAYELVTPQTSAPAAAILLSPSGPIPASLPAFRWKPVSGVTSYYLWVSTAQGTVFREWFRADVNCTPTQCWVISPVRLGYTAHTWWVQTYNPTGGYGAWSAPKNFTVNEPPPPAPVLTVPSGTITTSSPIFRWSKAVRATNFVLSVTGPSGSVILQAFAADAVCTTSCSIVSPIKLWNNAYSWQVQAYGVGGYGPWSAPKTFTVNEAPPARAVLIAPTTTVDTNHPTFTWNPAVRATNYTLSVKTNAGATVINESFEATAICTATLCSASVPSVDLANGGYKWQVQTYGPGGYGTWSLIKAFTVNAAGPVAVPPTFVPSN
jgi:CSLREA domain-containing protein